MILYAESSAILAWWLEEPFAAEVRSAIAEAEFLVSSDLTRIECQRAFHRGLVLGRASPSLGEQLWQRASAFWSRCHMLEFDAEVIEAAGQPFPAEPIRTLDAIHLAFWAQAHRTLGEVTMLSLDRRVRAVTRALGGHLAPEAVD